MLEVFHHLFSWTSIGPSKSLIDKVIVLQGRLNVWTVPRVRYVLTKDSLIERFFEMNKC